MKKFFSIIEKIFPQKKKSKHYDDIKEGETVLIDGKKYTKIKIEFIDTYNIDTTRTIEKLESEIEFLNGKIEIQSERIEYYKNTFAQLKTYIRNLHIEKQIDKAEYKSRIRNVTDQLLDFRRNSKAETRELKNELNALNFSYQTKIETIEADYRKQIKALKENIRILMKKNAESISMKNKATTFNPKIQIKNEKSKEDVQALITELKEQVSWQKKVIKSKDVKIRNHEILNDHLNKQLLAIRMKLSNSGENGK